MMKKIIVSCILACLTANVMAGGNGLGYLAAIAQGWRIGQLQRQCEQGNDRACFLLQQAQNQQAQQRAQTDAEVQQLQEQSYRMQQQQLYSLQQAWLQQRLLQQQLRQMQPFPYAASH